MQQPSRLKPVTRLAAATLISLGSLACGTLHAQSGAFTLSSPDLASGSFDTKFVLNGFGCKGDNVSPALEWKNVPAGTKSLSLLVHDPDAPTGSGPGAGTSCLAQCAALVGFGQRATSPGCHGLS